MDIYSLMIVIVAAVYAMLSLMALVLLARRVSMLDYCLRELEKKLPILIPSDLPAPTIEPVKTVVLSPGPGLSQPIGSVELVKKPESKSKLKKAPKSKTSVTKKGRK